MKRTLCRPFGSVVTGTLDSMHTDSRLRECLSVEYQVSYPKLLLSSIMKNHKLHNDFGILLVRRDA